MRRSRRIALFGFGAVAVVGLAALLYYWKLTADVAGCSTCLPTGMSLSSEMIDDGGGIASKGQGETVRHRLLLLGAYCQGGQIYDRWGKPVLFRKVMCEGPPPPPGRPDLSWADLQEKELSALRQHYTVITYCGLIP